MKKLVLTKNTIRDLSRPELEVVAGGDTAPPGPKCCDTTGTTHNCCDDGPTSLTCVR